MSGLNLNDVLKDVNPAETQEWIEALEAVLETEGPRRAHFLLEKLIDRARRREHTFLLKLLQHT